ncbi:MAG: hybrid sensor histidine kinase/response regulator [Kiritimatiellae bacterium]|nr:hybrid sensor histidine kinase/response regulator [Kiritimatiellia bacterium]
MTPCGQPEQIHTHPTILVIDDERGPRESLRFLLKDEYRVLCADTVESGIQLMHEQSPDTVIMDIRMPGRDGLDGLREIRKLDSNLAVIMLTGFAAVGTAQEAIRHEASDYMEKPFDAHEMRRAVHRHVEQTRLRRKQGKLLNEADALDQRISELKGKERLAELGQSSAEFVHDLRNTLTIVTITSGLLRMEMEELQQRQSALPSEASSHIDMLENSMRRCVEMLDTWQRLIQQDPQRQTRFPIHEFVRSCVDLCRPAAQAVHAQVVCENLGDDAELLGDRVQLARVLNNLIQNAIHALPAVNGLLRVRSKILDTSVRVSVSDNGCGISEETLKHIFSPDFTTRRKLGGMGLGLFIAQKVAQAHGGTVTVESAVNQGATFTLQLPRTAAVTGDGAA